MSTFGEELKRERELREISLREISEATKISLRHLEALERNDFQPLPGGVFNRGFVRAYAQFIGVDPEAMVNAYLLEEQTQDSGADPGVMRSKRMLHNPTATSSEPRPLRRILTWAVVLLVVVGGLVGGIYYYLQRERSESAHDPDPTPAQSLLAEPLPAHDAELPAEDQAAATPESQTDETRDSRRGDHVE
jgi:cytoskeleton protein RodZ